MFRRYTGRQKFERILGFEDATELHGGSQIVCRIPQSSARHPVPCRAGASECVERCLVVASRHIAERCNWRGLFFMWCRCGSRPCATGPSARARRLAATRSAALVHRHLDECSISLTPPHAPTVMNSNNWRSPPSRARRLCAIVRQLLEPGYEV
jgi:hypothetical protein